MFYVPPEPCKHINPPRFLFIYPNSPYNTAILWPWCFFFWSKVTFWRPFSVMYTSIPQYPFRDPLYVFPGKKNPETCPPFISMHVFPHNPNGHSSVITNYKHFILQWNTLTRQRHCGRWRICLAFSTSILHVNSFPNHSRPTPPLFFCNTQNYTRRPVKRDRPYVRIITLSPHSIFLCPQ